MPEAAFTLTASIKIDGTPLADNLIPLVEQVSVDDYLHLPDMFVLTFRDIDHNVLSQAKLKIGSDVRIEATALGESRPGLLIAGEVTSIEAEYGPAGNRAVVRGYDPSHRLHRGRHTATFRKMKDSDIAKKLAGAAGLRIGTVDDTGQVFDHVSQANITDWEFLASRAQEIGFEVAVDDGKFHFRKPTQSGEGPGGGGLLRRGAHEARHEQAVARIPAARYVVRTGQGGPGPGLGSEDEEGTRRQGTGQDDERQAQGHTG